MSEPAPSTRDEEFGARLAAMDLALAAGHDPAGDSAHASDEIRADLDGGLQVLRQLHKLSRPRSTVPDNNTVAAGHCFGRFLIRRLVGRGGFGSVFLAFDPTLDREVALKIPHPEALVTVELRERFRREAQATAGLDHPNIVPVYEAGTVGPLCYLVSAYCAGGNVAQFLQEHAGPQCIATTAEWLRQLADGVQHAHERGVLHRDLKPANILMSGGPLDSAVPTVKVADFGLAKIVDDDPGLTHSGLMLGTPQYMAPEQTTASCGAVGPATDVYGLGVVLYELLVGRPPFLAESSLETLRQVRELDPVPPRQLRPTVPRDLETICLKCLEKEPTRRYTSAAALRDELRLYLDGKPISARPTTNVEKVIRWGRRHPLSAGLILALVVCYFGGLTAVLWQWQRAQALAVQNALERDRVEKNYQRAEALVERLSHLGGEIARKPGLDKSRQTVYDELLKYYREVLEERNDDPRVVREAARAAYNLGRMCGALGQKPAADEAFQTANGLYRRLRVDFPTDPELRAAQGECLRSHGIMLRPWNRTAAMAAFAAAVELFEGLASEMPQHDNYQSQLANSLLNWAGARQFDSASDAGQAIMRAQMIYRRLLDAKPADVDRRSEYALAVDDLGYLKYLDKRYEEAQMLMREALAFRTELVAEQPTSAAFRFMLARSHERIGALNVQVQDFAQAEHAYRECIRWLDNLNVESPDLTDNHWLLANNLNRLANILEHQGRWVEMIELYRRALVARRRMVMLVPNDPDVHKHLARQLYALATTLTTLDQQAEAILLLREALTISPDDIDIINALVLALSVANDHQQRKPSEAVALADKSVRAAPKLPDSSRALGAARFAAGDSAGAILAFEKAVELGQDNTVAAWLLLANAHSQLGQTDRARAAWEKAVVKPNESPLTQRLRAEVRAMLGDK